MRAFSKPQCSVDDCTRPHKGRGYCEVHLRRVRKHGDPQALGESGRPLKGENPSWAAVHKRLARSRGKAAALACVDCGDPAREWSYDGTDPAELVAMDHGWLLAYSLDLDRYVPRCPSCHRLFDNAQRRQRSAIVTITEVTP